MKPQRNQILVSTLALAALCAAGPRLCAQQSSAWANTAGGSWANTANWNGGLIASGSGNTADFSELLLTAGPTVTLDGALTIGNLVFGDLGNTYGWTLNTGSAGPLTLAGGTPTITVASPAAVTNTIGLVLGGSAGLTVNATNGGYLKLNNINTFTGNTIVNSGTLLLNGNSGGSGTILGTLTINQGANVVATIGNATGYSGTYWTRTVNVWGGTYVAGSTGDTGWGVTYNMAGGTLRTNGILASQHFAFGNGTVVNTYATNGPSTIAGAINLRDAAATSFTANVALGATSSATSPDLLDSSIIVAQQSGGGITKAGPGFMSLTAANTYNGPTLVTAGTLVLGNGGSAGTIGSSAITILPGAEIDLNANDALGYSSASPLTNMGTLKKINNQAETLYRPLYLSNAVMTSSTAVPTTSEAYETFGNFIQTLPKSTNYIMGNGKFGLRTASCYMAAAANSVLNISSIIEQNVNSSGTPFNFQGPGMLILSAANTFPGIAFITNGTLQLNGSLAGPLQILNNGVLSSGPAISTITINNTLTLNSGGTALMKITKTAGILTNDMLQGVTTLNYNNGTLTVTNITSDGTLLALGDTFTLCPAGAYLGALATINLPAPPANTKWDTSQLSVNGSIKIIAQGVVSTPVFSPPAGGYIGAQAVTITSDAGSTIYYTLDGTAPTTGSPSGPSPVTVHVPVNVTETISAFAGKSGSISSATATAIYSTLDHGTWLNAAGGSWPVTANWSNGVVATGSGILADFSTLSLTANATVTLDGAVTVGELLLGDIGNAYNWTFNTTGPLTLDSGATQPSIVINNMTTIINSLIAGTNGFIQSGAGTLALGNAANSFSGNLAVNGGFLTTGVGAASASTGFALGAKTAGRLITVGSAGTMTFTVNNVVGGGGMYATNLPTFVVAGTLNSTRYNALPNLVLNGGTLTQSSTDNSGGTGTGTYGGWQFIGTVTVTGTTPSTISSGNGNQDQLLTTGTTFYVADVTGDANPDLIVSCPLRNSSGDYAPSTTGILVKDGPGTMQLTGNNIYTGSTIVSNGTLQVDSPGSIAAGGLVTVLANATLDGSGTILCPVSIQPGGNLTTTPGVMGTLYINSALTNAGNINLRISKNGGGTASDLITGMSSLVYGGTLNVTNITTDGTPLGVGDAFYLFSGAAAYSGVFAAFNLPVLPAGLSWDKSQLPVNGSIVVANTAATPYFSPVAGNYIGGQLVSIIADPGSTIYYTTDGTYPPTAASPHGATPVTGIYIPVGTTETIYAYATRPGYAASPIASATYTTIPEAVWTDNAGGSWPGAYNWLDSVVGAGAGVTADFSTLTLFGDTTVTLDSVVTIGNLIFADQGNSYNWILTNGTGGPLVLASTNTPTVTVNNMTTHFTSPVNGTNGLIKAGAGTLALDAYNTLTNGVTVNGGVLYVNSGNGNPGAVGAGNVTVNSGGTIQVGTNNNSFVGIATSASNYITINTGGLVMATNGTTCHLMPVVLNGGVLGATTPYLTWGNWNFDHGVSTLGNGTTSYITGGDAALVQTGGSVFNIGSGDTVNVTTVLEHTTSAADNGLVKAGPGLLILGATNTYTSATTVSNGTLEVDGSIATGAVTVTNAILDGAGLIGGAVTFQSGGILTGSLTIPGQVTFQSGAALSGSPTLGSPTAIPAGVTLAPGTTSLGTITITNGLTLAGTANFRLQKAGAVLTNDKVQGLTSVTYGGSLTVTASGDPLANGDVFTLFASARYAGAFASITLPALPVGLTWDLSSVAINGAIKVSNVTETPIFNPPGGGYGGSLSVTISSTAGATIFYTTDGSPPTTASPNGPSPLSGIIVPVNTTMTISAFATNANLLNSPVATATYITLATPTWTNLAGGSWVVPANWLDTAIANGSGVPADFSTLTLSSNTVVTLDGSLTVGQLIIGDVGNAYTWTINNGTGGPLTLDAGAAAPVITALSTNTINALLTGTNGLIKAGAGVLALDNNANSYAGNVTVNQGLLIAGGAMNPTTSTTSDLGAKTAAHIITVNTNATMAWTINNVFGGAGMTNTTLPSIVIDGGSFVLPRYNAIGNLALRNGASLIDAIPTTTDSVNYDGAQFLGTITVRGSVPSTISTSVAGRGDHLLSGSAITFDVADVTGDAGADLTVSCPLHDGSNDYNTNGLPSSLTKIGSGTLVLSGANSYTGTTTVNAGAIEVDGSLSTNAVVVNTGGALAGSGLINGPVTVSAGSLLAPGMHAAPALGTLTINNSLTLAGTTSFRLNKTGSVLTSDLVTGLSQVTYGGTLAATVTGDPLAVNDTFTLFSTAASAGAFTVTNLPALPGSLALSWNPTAGTLTVISNSVNTQPPHLTATFSHTNVNLSWPADHTGWRLVVQTNSVKVGLSTNWYTWPGSSSVNSVSTPIDPANGTVFYRLVYP